MKTENELNSDILKITASIQARFPELSKYICEMPLNMPDAANAEINFKSLQNYYDSLASLLKNYATYHLSAMKHISQYSNTHNKTEKQ